MGAWGKVYRGTGNFRNKWQYPGVEWSLAAIKIEFPAARLSQPNPVLFSAGRRPPPITPIRPPRKASQRKVLHKLFDAGPNGFAGGMSTERYTAIAQVSRATAYRELTDLAALGVLVKSGQGRGTRYALSGALEGVSG